MTKECVTSLWERIEIVKSPNRLNATLLEEEPVAVDSKRLYIGHGSQWTIKAKNVQEMKLEGDETKPPSVVLTIVTADLTIRLIRFLQDVQWTKFFKRLQTFVKHSDTHLQLPSSSTSSTTRLTTSSASNRNKSRSGATKSARKLGGGEFFESTGKMRFSPSRPTRALQQKQSVSSPFPAVTSPAPAVRRGRTFGRQAPRLTPSSRTRVPWDEDDNELIVHPSPPVSARKSKTKLDWEDDQVMVDDEDEHVRTDDGAKKTEGENDDDDDDDEALFDEAPSGTSKRKVIEDSDDDNDDDRPVIDSTEKSTPAKTKTQKVNASSSTNKGSPQPRTAQNKISSFFQQRPFKRAEPPKMSSFDPSKRAAPPSTPPRPASTPKKSGDWLRGSKAGLTSPTVKRKKDLFGTLPKTISPAKHDDDDPIEEYASPSRPRRNPLDLLDQADRDPLRKRIDFLERATTGAKPKRPRLSDEPVTPKRLSLDSARRDDENAIVPRLPWRGLRNMGNTCYLNSSIQMLLTLMSTAEGKTNWWEKLRGKGGPLTTSLVRVMDQLVLSPQPGMMNAVNPIAVKREMDAITDKFIGFQQHDAHEFLNDLIDAVHEELRKHQHNSLGDTGEPASEREENPADETENTNNTTANRTSKLPTDDFRLTMEVSLRCESCGYSRSKQEMYRHLSLDIVSDNGNQKGSIPTSLNKFFEPQVLEIRCEKCANGTHASQRMKILSSPKYLLLHLKRFIFVEMPIPSGSENAPPNSPSSRPQMEYIFKKNKSPVDLVENVSLDPFCGSPSAKEYRLQSIVHHIGARPSSGHYLADALRPYRSLPKPTNATDAINSPVADTTSAAATTPDLSIDVPHPEEEWITFDDGNSCKTSLKKIQENTTKQQTAYMLLYCLDP